MPRDIAGTYTLPAGNPVISGTIISSSWANTTMEDMANAMTDSLSRSGSGGMLAPLYFANGSEASPSASFINGPTFGLWYDEINSKLGLSGGGNGGLEIGATGNVLFDVSLNGITPTVFGYLSGVTSSIQDQLNSKQDTVSLTASRALVSDGSGNIAVSAVTSSELDYLDGVTSSIQTQLNGKLTTTGTDVKTSGTLRFNDSIVLSFGTGADAEFLCNGSHFYLDLNAGINNFYIRDGTVTRFTFDDAGSFTATGNVSAYSDKKLKSNITKIDNALGKVLELNGYTFDRTDIETPRQTGVIAQEVQKVLPEAVTESEDGTLTVAYGNMVGLLIESIKELEARIAELEG